MDHSTTKSKEHEMDVEQPQLETGLYVKEEEQTELLINDMTGRDMISDRKMICLADQDTWLWNQFDVSFLVIMLICNFSMGFEEFLKLSLLSLYKDYLNIEPAEVEMFMGLMFIPWSFRIIYGFMSDNIFIMNSKRRGHIMMNCTCCILVITSLILFGNNFGKYFITFCVFVSQINMAYSETVIDALTCKAAKKGVKNGNENLNSISLLFKGIGAVTGAWFSDIFSEYGK
jgi:hypothetical protein